MSAITVEGVVERGQIKLDPDICIPEGTKVYVVVPDVEIKEATFRLHSPRLAHPEDTADFHMEVRKS